MGWWGAEIMAGDEPLDDFGSICDAAVPGKYRGGNSEVLTRKALNASLPQIIRQLEKENKGYPRGMNIALQVLGVTIMERGADMPAGLRKRILEAAEDDEWAKEGDEERVACEEAFAAKVKAYEPGKRVDCSAEHGGGLLAKICEHIEGGKTGLVNRTAGG